MFKLNLPQLLCLRVAFHTSTRGQDFVNTEYCARVN